MLNSSKQQQQQYWIRFRPDDTFSCCSISVHINLWKPMREREWYTRTYRTKNETKEQRNGTNRNDDNERTHTNNINLIRLLEMNAIHEIIYHILCGHTFRRRRRFFYICCYSLLLCLWCCFFSKYSIGHRVFFSFILLLFFQSHWLHTPLFSLLIKRHSASFSILSD